MDKGLDERGRAMNMHERIEAGLLFTDNCEGLPEERAACKRHMIALNQTGPDDFQARIAAEEALFGRPTMAWVEPPFYCCYGTHIRLGEGTYINFNCNFVDDGQIVIGKRVMFGPAVTIATVGHPIDPSMREYMYTDPVTIEDDCWIGANVTICPGVTIGRGTTIGAGSVVTRSVPAGVVAVGNPCKVLREIGEHDREFYYKDRPIDAKDLEEERLLRQG